MFSMQLAFWDSAWDMHIVTYRNAFWLLQNLVFSVVILNSKSLRILIQSPFIKLYYWRNIFLHYVILSHIYHFRQLPVILYSYFTKINYDLWTDEWIDLLFLVSCPERALNRMFDVRVPFIAFNDFCCVLCLFLVIYILLSTTLLDDVSAKDIYSGTRWKHIEMRSLYIVSMSLECIQFGRQNWSSILMTVWLLSLFDITRRTDIIEYSWNEFWMNSVSLASSGYYHWYGWNCYGLSSTTYKPIFTSQYSFEFLQTFK